MNNYNKIGFWPTFAIVTSSQIGSGIFMLPATLAPYGLYSIAGWFIAGIAAISLAIVFANLCMLYPQTGGPHAYVKQAFGPTPAFFTGWTYWIISWISSTAVIVATVGYLSPLFGNQSQGFYVFLEILLLLGITLLNLKGIRTSGTVEFVLTILKFIPLLLIPIFALAYFDINNFVISETIQSYPLSTILGKATLLTLWGFIGLETATTPAGCITNPQKTIPLAIITGTAFVALLYLLNSIGLMGVMPNTLLKMSAAPYSNATQIIFGGNWNIAISLIAAFVCISSFNAWMLTSGQISLGLAEDKFLPRIFSYKNTHEAPITCLIVSALGIFPLLLLTGSKSLVHQITTIIDFSVTAFLFVYLICCFSYIKIQLQQKRTIVLGRFGASIIATLFVLWVIFETPLSTILIASLFVLSGLPFYLFWYKKDQSQTK